MPKIVPLEEVVKTDPVTGELDFDGMAETVSARSGGASMELTLSLLWFEHASDLQKKYGLKDYDAVLDLLAQRLTGVMSRENLEYIGYSDEKEFPDHVTPCTLSKKTVTLLIQALEIQKQGDSLSFRSAAALQRRQHLRDQDYTTIWVDEDTQRSQKALIHTMIAHDIKNNDLREARQIIASDEAQTHAQTPLHYVVNPESDSNNPVLREIAHMNWRIHEKYAENERLTSNRIGLPFSTPNKSQLFRNHLLFKDVLTTEQLAKRINSRWDGHKTVDEWDFYGARSPGKVLGVGQDLAREDFILALASCFFRSLNYEDPHQPDEIAMAKESGEGLFNTPDSDRREVFYDAIEHFCDNIKGLDIIRGQYHARKNFSQLMRVMMSEVDITNPQIYALLKSHMGDKAPVQSSVYAWSNPAMFFSPHDEEAELLADKIFVLPDAEKNEFIHSIQRARWGQQANKHLKAFALNNQQKYSGQNVMHAMFGGDVSETAVRHMALDMNTYASVIRGVLDGDLPLTPELANRIGNFYILTAEARDILVHAAQSDAKAPIDSDEQKIYKYTNEVLANVKASDSLGNLLLDLFAEPNELISPRLMAQASRQTSTPLDRTHLYRIVKEDTSASVHQATTAEGIGASLKANPGAIAVLKEVALKHRPYLSIGHTLDCYIRTGQCDLHGYVDSLNRDFGITPPQFAEMCDTTAAYLNSCMDGTTGLGNRVMDKMDERFSLNERQKAVLRLVARGGSKQEVGLSIAKAETELRKLGDGQHDSAQGRAIATTLLNELAAHSGLTNDQIAAPLSIESAGTILHWKQGITWTEEFIRNIPELAQQLVAHDPVLAPRAAIALLGLPQHYTLQDFATADMKPDAIVRAIHMQRHESRDEFVAALERMGREIFPDFDQISRTGINYYNLTRMESGRGPVNSTIAAVLSKMAEEGSAKTVGASTDDTAKMRDRLERKLAGKKALSDENPDFGDDLKQLQETQDRAAFLKTVMKKRGYDSIADLSRALVYKEQGETKNVGAPTVAIWLKRGTPIKSPLHLSAIAELTGLSGEDRSSLIDVMSGKGKKQEASDDDEDAPSQDWEGRMQSRKNAIPVASSRK